MSAELHSEEQQPAEGLTTGLFHSFSNFIATLLGSARTRIQLLTTELQEEVQQAAKMLLWAFVAVFAGMMALFLGALTLVFAFWDTHRLLVALSMVGFFTLTAVLSFMVLRHKLRTRPPLLHATLSELAKDEEQLRARP